MYSKLATLCVATALIGCSEDNSAPEVIQNTPAQAVTTLIKVAETVPSKTFYGRIEGSDNIDMALFAAGRIEQLYVRAGQYVEQGDVLAKLYSPDLQAKTDSQQASLLSAQSSLIKAEADYARTRELVLKELQPKSALDQAKANRDVAKQAVNQALAALKEAQNLQAENLLKANRSGVISEVHFRVGDYVASGQPLLRFQAKDALKVNFKLPEEDAIPLVNGKSVEVFVPAINESLTGKVIERALPLGDNSLFFTVMVELKQASDTLLGLRAKLLLPVTSRTLYEVPPSALRYDKQNTPYLLLDSQPNQKVPVSLVATSANKLLVTAEQPLRKQTIITSEAKLAMNLVNIE
ncbi:efflux RND transporter periplasmic adaptor subunit [Pseudoalteromonas sp. T1lg65]|uniref:efflux RND transporter periplasmic adaptor subunit n=1 Tax=Pseudoalteromonas sp. T1lg65 TaxID=2077101 RepID=UPI003F797C87